MIAGRVVFHGQCRSTTKKQSCKNYIQQQQSNGKTVKISRLLDSNTAANKAPKSSRTRALVHNKLEAAIMIVVKHGQRYIKYAMLLL